MKIAPPVTVLVVTYQSERTLDPLFRSLDACRDAGLIDCVVVDNSSLDGTTDRVACELPWATLIHAGSNLGFGRGCNLGIERVQTPYTLLLNPDAAIEPASLTSLLAFLQASPRAGIVGPATLCGLSGEPAVLQITGRLPTPASIVRAAVPGIAADRTASQPIEPGVAAFRTGWVCGAVFLIRTELLRRLGGFDPRFFLYWEETDLCRRAAQIGFETWALGTAIARHIAGASSMDEDSRIAGCIARHYYQSRRHYLVKHHGWLAATAAELAEFGLLCAGAALDMLRGRGASKLRPRLQAALLSLPE